MFYECIMRARSIVEKGQDAILQIILILFYNSLNNSCYHFINTLFIITRVQRTEIQTKI